MTFSGMEQEEEELDGQGGWLIIFNLKGYSDGQELFLYRQLTQ